MELMLCRLRSHVRADQMTKLENDLIAITEDEEDKVSGLLHHVAAVSSEFSDVWWSLFWKFVKNQYLLKVLGFILETK